MELIINAITHEAEVLEYNLLEPTPEEANMARIEEIDSELASLDNSLNRGTEDLINTLISVGLLTKEQLQEDQPYTYSRLARKQELRDERAKLKA